RSAAQYLHGYLGDALSGHADYLGCRPRQVDDAAGDVGPPIIDGDVHRTTASAMGNAHAGTKGQFAVGSGHGVGIEPAPGSEPLVFPIVGRYALLIRAAHAIAVSCLVGQRRMAARPVQCRLAACAGATHGPVAVAGGAASVPFLGIVV